MPSHTFLQLPSGCVAKDLTVSELIFWHWFLWGEKKMMTFLRNMFLWLATVLSWFCVRFIQI